MIERPTLLLLHGGPGADHSLFKPEFAAVSDVAQIVYLDQRGSGRSDTSSPAMWNWQQWADDVAAFCRTLDIPRPVLVGASSGALVALKCAWSTNPRNTTTSPALPEEATFVAVRRHEDVGNTGITEVVAQAIVQLTEQPPARARVSSPCSHCGSPHKNCQGPSSSWSSAPSAAAA